MSSNPLVGVCPLVVKKCGKESKIKLVVRIVQRMFIHYIILEWVETSKYSDSEMIYIFIKLT